jgi:ABC-2 type transport system permease protein
MNLWQPSFIFFAFGVPVIAVIAIGAYTLIKGDQGAEISLEQTEEN